ncbi:ABC transporter type 1, transmembrane domain-containing protein [Cladochytrium replicatum]|nr:ABC transporter type 1, transmembrane domain-containing protein [Cladochytrium replicatum]
MDKSTAQFDKSQNDPTARGDLPLYSTNVVSKVLMSWVDPLVRLGWKRPLNPEDLWSVGPDFSPSILSERFAQLWEEERRQVELDREKHLITGRVGGGTADDPEPVLERVLFKMFFWTTVPLGVLKFLSDASRALSPFVIKLVVDALIVPSEDNSITKPMLLLLGLFMLQLLDSFGATHFGWCETYKESSRYDLTLTAVLYRKMLRLSSAARSRLTTGKLVNVISTDASGSKDLDSLSTNSPLQIIVIVAFLLTYLGWPALMGCMAPLQGRLIRKFRSMRTKVAPLADERIRFIEEVIGGIRGIKYLALEALVGKKVKDIREKELGLVWKRSNYRAFAVSIPVFAAAISFAFYAAFANRNFNKTSAGVIIASLSWFAQLRGPLYFLPSAISSIGDCRVAAQRIVGLLMAPEILESVTDRVVDLEPARHVPHDDIALRVVDGEFVWEEAPPVVDRAKKESKFQAWKKSTMRILKGDRHEQVSSDDVGQKDDKLRPTSPFRLQDINLSIPRGSLVAVVGSVGSGKTSLLNALTSEMKRVKGTVEFVYAGTAGAQRGSGTVKDNKTDGSDEAQNFRIAYCSQQSWIQTATVQQNITLGQNLDDEEAKERYCKVVSASGLFPDFEILTQIGEKGINLSGGQKQRVSLARSAFFKPSIALLDDPLSAVDVHVGSYILNNLIGTSSTAKPTEQTLPVLSRATRIVVTSALSMLPRMDHIIVMKDGRIAEQGPYAELMNLEENGELLNMVQNSVKTISSGETSEETGATMAPETTGVQKKNSKKSNFIEEESRSFGAVKPAVFLRWATSGGGMQLLALVWFFILAYQGLVLGQSLWIIVWTDLLIPNFGVGGYVGVYAGLGLAQCIATYIFFVSMGIFSNRASSKLHDLSIKRILQAPIRFFDTTPVGRIVNRFSRDIDSIDYTLSSTALDTFESIASVLSRILFIAVSTPIFLAILAPLSGLYAFIWIAYRRSAREVQRITANASSPVIAFVGETYNGLPVIRMFGVQNQFIEKFNHLQINAISPQTIKTYVTWWMSMRLDMIGSLIVLATGALGLIGRSQQLQLVGLMLMFAMQITSFLSDLTTVTTMLEVELNSAERIEEYAFDREVESPTTIQPQFPDWKPSQSIEVVDSRSAIRRMGPMYFGTSASKSAPVNELPSLGERGADTRAIPLFDLRSNITFIPQEPVLFKNTVRYNMDPFSVVDDADIWRMLEKVQLKTKVAELGGLDAVLSNGGESLSAGQSQLLSIGRAALRKSKIVLLDEASASLDLESDRIIQEVMRQEFDGATIITIAHRINTILDYDKSLVLSSGEIAEFDTIPNLLKQDGAFAGMAREAGCA